MVADIFVKFLKSEKSRLISLNPLGRTTPFSFNSTAIDFGSTLNSYFFSFSRLRISILSCSKNLILFFCFAIYSGIVISAVKRDVAHTSKS